MIKLNTDNSKHKLLATQNPFSNTPLFLQPSLSLSSNSFNLLLPTFLDSQLFFYTFRYLLDYLRVSSNNLPVKSFDLLTTILFSQVDSKVINKPSHPHPGTPKSKKYQTRIVSSTGIVLRYTKRAKYRGKNTRYVYDIMIAFTGSYFANFSLLEQIELINYLGSIRGLKCHRIDVAVDDYSRRLFPVNKMIVAYLEVNYFGFKDIDDSYLDIIDNLLVGTLGIGSRRSSLFIRIYTKHKYFVRWEAEFKQKKAQKLFKDLFNLSEQKSDDIRFIKDIQKTLAHAALDCIGFRDKHNVSSAKNATKARTEPLPFWQICIDKVFSSIENLTNINHVEVS